MTGEVASQLVQHLSILPLPHNRQLGCRDHPMPTDQAAQLGGPITVAYVIIESAEALPMLCVRCAR